MSEYFTLELEEVRPAVKYSQKTEYEYDMTGESCFENFSRTLKSASLVN